MIAAAGLLYIEPCNDASTEPVIDELTRRMAAALRTGVPGSYHPEMNHFGVGVSSRGVHCCVCGAASKAQDFQLPSGIVTNSLAVHYLAHHREEVPAEEIVKVKELPVELGEPTEEELQTPAR